MSPGQSKLPSDSIKVVPNRSKVRVESSNPVARGNPVPKPSKVKLITPDEAKQLSFGANRMAVSPLSQSPRPMSARRASELPRHMSARGPYESPRPMLPRAIYQSPRPMPARGTSESPRPRPAYAPLEPPRPMLAHGTSESPRPMPARARVPFESPRPMPAHATSESPRPFPARAFSESPRPKPVRATSEAPGPKPVRATSEAPRPFLASHTPEAPRPVPASPTSEAPRPLSACPTSTAPRPVPACPTPEAPRPVRAHPAPGFRKEIICGLRALCANTIAVSQRTNPSLLQSRTVEPPPSPRALLIRARIEQQDANATQVVEGTVVEVGERAKDHGSKETCQSTSNETLSELLRYRPALHPTWRGRIVDSVTLPEFDCKFWAKPASNINRKVLRLSRVMPTLLKVELLPTGHILNDIFDRSPRLSNVEMYLFPDENKTERFKGEHSHLFEAMATRKAMIKVNITGTDLLIFSSKLLDKTSQFLIMKQKKTENYLWGFFLQNKNSEALVPGTSYQTDKDLEDNDVVDMDLETAYPTPSVALKLIAESESIPSRSPVKVNKDVSLPPGFEKIWAPPLVKLNIHGTSDHFSELTGSAGLVRKESGKWVFGYSRCHKSISEVTAGLLAIYHGLRLLWNSGCRRIRLETTSVKIIDALTTNVEIFHKRKSILGVCKDMILKEWECGIYLVSKEENLCAEWLASRLKEQPQGLVFYEYPPLGLLNLL